MRVGNGWLQNSVALQSDVLRKKPRRGDTTLAGGGASREAASATPGRRLSRLEPRQGRQTGSRGGGRAKPDRNPGDLQYLPSWGTERYKKPYCS